MSKILLTGASGHLGTAILKRLLLNPTNEVFSFVQQPASAHRLRKIFDNPRLRVEARDLTSSSMELPKNEKWDRLIHNAAFIPAERDERGSIQRLNNVNICATAGLLSQLTGRVQHCVIISSLSVYAPQEHLNEHTPLNPNTLYGASKLGCEKVAEYWAQQNGVPLMVLRLASIYGPGETQARVLPIFFQRAMRGQDIFLQGFGSARRNYVYVGDAAAATDEAGERKLAGVINLAGEQIFTLAELAREVVKVCSSRSLVYCLPGGSSADLILDTAKARDSYGLRCNTALAKGLKRQHDWLAAQSGSTPEFLHFL